MIKLLPLLLLLSPLTWGDNTSLHTALEEAVNNKISLGCYEINVSMPAVERYKVVEWTYPRCWVQYYMCEGSGRRHWHSDCEVDLLLQPELMECQLPLTPSRGMRYT